MRRIRKALVYGVLAGLVGLGSLGCSAPPLADPPSEDIPQMARSRDPYFRARAALLIGQAKSQDYVPILITLATDEKPEVQDCALWAIEQVPDRQATAALISLVTDQSSPVRDRAARALGKIQDPAAVPALIIALADPDQAVGAEAAAALGEMGTAAIPPLAESLNSQEASVRLGAVRALGKITGQWFAGGDIGVESALLWWEEKGKAKYAPEKEEPPAEPRPPAEPKEAPAKAPPVEPPAEEKKPPAETTAEPKPAEEKPPTETPKDEAPPADPDDDSPLFRRPGPTERE